MKKILVLAALATLVSTSAFAAISGTKHDLSAYSTGDEVCVFCHTPHGADTAVSKAPLWNRSTTNAAATLYAGLDLEAVQNQAAINASDAPLCLSCHDGVVTETLKNEPNSGTTSAVNNIAGAGNLTADMSNDHPIGMSYDVADAGDAELVAIATVTGATGMTGAFYAGTASNEMWCSSCHDVHSNANGAFLRVNNAGSNLCTTCHVK